MTTINMPNTLSKLLTATRTKEGLVRLGLTWVHVETTADHAVFVTTDSHILVKVVSSEKLIEAGDYLPSKALAREWELNLVTPEKGRSFPQWLRVFPSEEHEQVDVATLCGSMLRADARFCIDAKYLTILAATGYDWKITQQKGRTVAPYVCATGSMEPEWTITVLIMPVQDTE
jgi:hypothetical protein